MFEILMSAECSKCFFPDIKTVFVILCNQITGFTGRRQSHAIVHLMKIDAGHYSILFMLPYQSHIVQQTNHRIYAVNHMSSKRIRHVVSGDCIVFLCKQLIPCNWYFRCWRCKHWMTDHELVEPFSVKWKHASFILITCRLSIVEFHSHKMR